MEQRVTIAALRGLGVARATESKRDIRYDLFRGIALIAIFNDHVGDQFQLTWLKLMSLRPWGWSTGAEVFVFISGSMFGLVYSRHLRRQGGLSMTLKSLRRAAEIYFANLLTLLIVLTLYLLAQRLAPAFEPHRETRAFMAPTLKLVFSTLAMGQVPRYFDILPLYVALIGTAPAMLLLMDRSRKWAMTVSVLTYGIAVSIARLRGTTFSDDLGFQPFAWQFLFYCGVLITHVDRSGQRTRVPQYTWLTGLATIVVTASLFFKILRHVSVIGHVDLSYFPTWIQNWSTNGPPLSERVHLEPIRLIHFFSCAYLIARVTERHSPVLHSIWLRPFVAAGANSLKVFCVGLVLTHTTIILCRITQSGLAFRYSIAAVGVLVSLFVGVLLLHLKERSKCNVVPGGTPASTESI